MRFYKLKEEEEKYKKGNKKGKNKSKKRRDNSTSSLPTDWQTIRSTHNVGTA